MGLAARRLIDVPQLQLYRARDLGRLRRHDRCLPDDRARILPYRPMLDGAPTIAQTGSRNAVFGTAVSTSFSSNTSANNYLLYVLAIYGSFGASINLTGGASWSAVGNWSNSNSALWIWEAINAAQINSGVGFGASWTGGSTLATCTALEISGASTSSPRDGSPVSATGTSTSPAGGSFSNANATELILAFLVQTFAANGFITFSSPTPTGASIAVSGSSNNGVSAPHETVGVCVLDLTTSSQGSFAPGATSSVSDPWVGVTIGIQPASASVTGAGIQSGGNMGRGIRTGGGM